MNKSNFTNIFWLLLMLLTGSSTAYAQTDILGGNISGIWALSNSPYYIYGEVTIPNGETLNVEKGVAVIFKGYYKFNVQGRVKAIGIKQEMIVFTAENEDEGWHGFRFVDTPETNDTSKLIYCKIQYAKAKGSDNNGGAINISGSDKVLISNCIIKNNESIGDIQSGGGGVIINSCSPKIVNNIITNNIAAGGHGGGVFIVNNSYPIIMNNIIYNNEAYGGGGMAFYNCSPIIINNTLSNNIAIDHGGGADCINSSPIFINSILYGNSADIGNEVHFNAPPEPDFNFCDIQGGPNEFARNHTQGGGYDGNYSNNIDSDPHFQEVNSGNYHLSNTSPCIGAGYYEEDFTPLTDFEGNPRPNPVGSAPDIGAYECELGSPVTDINENLILSPTIFTLSQNYPNPFNPITTIEFSLPFSSVVTLKVFSLGGEEISTLVAARLSKGNYKYDWEAGDLTSGIYIYIIMFGKHAVAKKAMLIK